MVEEEEDDQEQQDSDDSDQSSESEVRATKKESTVPMKQTLPLRQAESRPKAPVKSGDDGVADLEKSMSALKFIPTSVTLNRRSKK